MVQTWLLNGMLLGLAATLLAAGSLADNRGRRRVFAAGSALLAAGIAGSALAPDAPSFVIARVVQGAASAALLAAGLGLLGYAYPTGPARVRATATWGAMLGAGIAVGPLISAGADRLTGWRSFYWAAAAAAVLLALAARTRLSESRAERPQRLDVPGVLALGGGLALLMAGVTEGRAGWWRPAALLPLAGAAVLVATFVVVERRRRAPMLDLGLFRRPAFVTATVGALVTGLAVIGPMTFLPTAVQRDFGYPALSAAAVIPAWAATSAAVSLLARRFGGGDGRWELAAGLGLSAAGYLAMLAAHGAVAGGAWELLLPGLVVAGFGSGLLNAALARLAVQSVPADRGAMGSGANNTARYIGSSLGLAAAVAAGGGTGPVLLVGAILAAAGALAVSAPGLAAAPLRSRNAAATSSHA